jgi:hypothetical protein
MTPRGPEPRTMEGRALLLARPLETETTSGRTLRSPDKVLRKAILAIEAEAASPDSEALRAVLKTMIEVFADGLGHHSPDATYCSLTDEGHAAIEQARAALTLEAKDDH